MTYNKMNRLSRNDVPGEGDMSEQEINVGERLRSLRNEHHKTIRELAEASGLSVNTLSLVENGKTSPSISTLQQIAQALDLPIVSFFESSVDEKELVFTRHDQRPKAVFEGMRMEDLGKGMQLSSLHPLVATVEPGGGNGNSTIIHQGHEFIYCLNGRILFEVESQPYLLEAGDSLLFLSHLRHRWQNVDDTPSSFLLVYYPSGMLVKGQ
jgi:transcriptional regulator with XRE-family HTH domain